MGDEPGDDDLRGDDHREVDHREDDHGEGERIEPYEAEHGRQDVYEVFVQWQRGRPHEHAETVNASDPDMALMLAKRNVDLRSNPVDIWVAPRRTMRRTRPGDTSLLPSTDRSYRETGWYAENRIEVE